MSDVAWWHRLDLWLSDAGYFFRIAGADERGVSRFVMGEGGDIEGVAYLHPGGPSGTLDIDWTEIKGIRALWVLCLSGGTVFVFLAEKLRAALPRWREEWLIPTFGTVRVPWQAAGAVAEYAADIHAGDGCVLQPRIEEGAEP